MTYILGSDSRKTIWDRISLAAQAALLIWAFCMLVLASYIGSMDIDHPETRIHAIIVGLTWAGPLFLYTLAAFILLLKRRLLGWWLSSAQVALFTIFIVLLFAGDLANLRVATAVVDRANSIDQLKWHIPILCACGISVFAMSENSLLRQRRLAIPTRAR